MAHLTLQQINHDPIETVVERLDGLYEHSSWIVQQALLDRPFRSAAHFKYVLTQVVQQASVEQQLDLIRAHPELAGKAMVAQDLTQESTLEQQQAGLSACSPEEFARIQQLNADYTARFGFPFVLAVRGPRGTGLSRAAIIETLERRLGHPADFERAEALRNIHRIAEIRLQDKLALHASLGQLAWDGMESLARYSEPEAQARGQLTVTYLTEAHRQCAAHIQQLMRDSGFDQVQIDAVGNVVGVYRSENPNARTLMTGSHYDTVRNGGKYDGRLGIYVPITVVAELARQQRRLPYHLEVVAFAEEEGQRYKATFLGSSALTGGFQSSWLAQVDADGITLREAMQTAGLDESAIAALKRDPAQYLGFIEVHIEQGPVLNELNIPLGIVTSINGSMRFVGQIQGMASHAGTTPMDRRRDAAVAVAELISYVEWRAAQDSDSVGTVGMLQVPNGSVNVVPGRCDFSLDLRAPNDAQRDALVQDVLDKLQAICSQRGLRYTLEESMRACAAPSDAKLQSHWEHAVSSLGLPVQRMPSGAGHDAMKLHEIMPQAMLFVRGEHSGISHNPLESSTAEDMELAIQAFAHVLDRMAAEYQ